MSPTVRLQVAAILLHTLAQEKCDRPKGMITAFIRGSGIFALQDEDEEPYPSRKIQGSDEPRWITLVALTRMEIVRPELGLMKEPIGSDRWRISGKGKEAWARFRKKCAEGVVDVRGSFLWTPKFKKMLDPLYMSSAADAVRPRGSIYEDNKYAAIASFLDAYRPFTEA